MFIGDTSEPKGSEECLNIVKTVKLVLSLQSKVLSLKSKEKH